MTPGSWLCSMNEENWSGFAEEHATKEAAIAAGPAELERAQARLAAEAANGWREPVVEETQDTKISYFNPSGSLAR